jgi:hypothetical protein
MIMSKIDEMEKKCNETAKKVIDMLVDAFTGTGERFDFLKLVDAFTGTGERFDFLEPVEEVLKEEFWGCDSKLLLEASEQSPVAISVIPFSDFNECVGNRLRGFAGDGRGTWQNAFSKASTDCAHLSKKMDNERIIAGGLGAPWHQILKRKK